MQVDLILEGIIGLSQKEVLSNIVPPKIGTAVLERTRKKEKEKEKKDVIVKSGFLQEMKKMSDQFDDKLMAKENTPRKVVKVKKLHKHSHEISPKKVRAKELWRKLRLLWKIVRILKKFSNDRTVY